MKKGNSKSVNNYTLHNDTKFLYLKCKNLNVEYKFNYSAKLKMRLKREIKGRKLIIAKDSNAYILQNCSKIPIAKYVYCIYIKESVGLLDKRKIKFFDGNKFNLTFENLKIQYVKVTHNEKHIYLSNGTDIAYTNYEPELYRLINSLSWCTDAKGKRFDANFNGKKIGFHVLVFIYKFRGCRLNNLERSFLEFQSKCHNEDNRFCMTVDHKKSDSFATNNTFENLQLISKSLNSIKKNITFGDDPSNFFIPITMDPINGCGEIVGKMIYDSNGEIDQFVILNIQKDYETHLYEMRNLFNKNVIPNDADIIECNDSYKRRIAA